MMKFPTYGTINFMFQTTNQSISISVYTPTYSYRYYLYYSNPKGTKSMYIYMYAVKDSRILIHILSLGLEPDQRAVGPKFCAPEPSTAMTTHQHRILFRVLRDGNP